MAESLPDEDVRERRSVGPEAEVLEPELGDGLRVCVRGAGKVPVVVGKDVVAALAPPLGGIAPAEVEPHLADVAARPVPVRVRHEDGVLGIELREHEWTVPDEVLGLAPVTAELLALVSWPGERPRRREDEREVVARLSEADLERALVERLSRLDILHQEGRP